MVKEDKGVRRIGNSLVWWGIEECEERIKRRAEVCRRLFACLILPLSACFSKNNTELYEL